MANERFCPECRELGLKSIVYEGMRTRTCMGISPAFWDYDGRYHPGVDPNKTTVSFSCSQGHKWSEEQ